jgi:hypothetical protein
VAGQHLAALPRIVFTGRCYSAVANKVMRRAMAQIHFTSWLRELVPDGPVQVSGAAVGAALDVVFAERPLARGYVLDRGRLRKRVCVFVDGALLKNTDALGHAIAPQTTLHVMQALSGG